jgi:hypothetical protein
MVRTTNPIMLKNGTLVPTAALKYRGEIRILEAGIGSRDELYVCLKSKTESYAWVKVAQG